MKTVPKFYTGNTDVVDFLIGVVVLAGMVLVAIGLMLL
jgi:hypothetical protein